MPGPRTPHIPALSSAGDVWVGPQLQLSEKATLEFQRGSQAAEILFFGYLYRSKPREMIALDLTIEQYVTSLL